MPDLIYSVPRPTYPVCYNGTMSPGGWFSGPSAKAVIPRIHRREGDVEDNPVASYLVTFEVQIGLPNFYVLIYDSISTTAGVRIDLSSEVGRQPWLFTFDNDLRMACNGTDANYYVLARYYLPNR